MVKLDQIIQKIIIVGLLIVALHMFLNKKLVNEGFAQGELIPSGQSLYTQEAVEQDLKNYIFNEGQNNETLDKSFVFTSNVIQEEDPNLARYEQTFRPQSVNNNQELQERISQRDSGERSQTYQSYGDNMKVYDYPDKEQTDLTGGKFGGSLMPFAEQEVSDYAML